MQNIAEINPLTTPFFSTTKSHKAIATTEYTAASNVAWVTAIAVGASAGAAASTRLHIFSPNTALMIPSASYKILTPDAECVARELWTAATARSISTAFAVNKFDLM